MSDVNKKFVIIRGFEAPIPPDNITRFKFDSNTARELALKSRRLANTIERLDGRYILLEPDDSYVTLFEGDILAVVSANVTGSADQSTGDSVDPAAFVVRTKELAAALDEGEATDVDVDTFLEECGDDIVTLLNDLTRLQNHHSAQWGARTAAWENYCDKVTKPLIRLLNSTQTN